MTAHGRKFPLKESFNWVEKNVIRNRKRKCSLPEGRREYAEKLAALKEIWRELEPLVKGQIADASISFYK